MKSINNLLLLGDGETWARQSVDFAGIPEMVRTFLQVAAGAADIPVTRLLGQSPSGLSATGESDARNYYDMIAARQELDLRPQLERLDRLILRSEGLEPDALTFAFRPLWQLDEPARAALALAKAQATQVYAGLKLWPDAVVARLAEAQLAADGTYPNAAAVFAGGGTAEGGGATAALDFSPAQPRDPDGRWTGAGQGSGEPDSSSGGAAEVLPTAVQPGPIGATEPGAIVGLHAPDGTPVTPAAGRSRALARALGAAAGVMGRLLRRWWPEGGDEPSPPPGTAEPVQAPSSASPHAEPPNQTMQDLARVERGFAGRKSAQKWLNQTNNRGWTPEQIEEATKSGERFSAPNRINPASSATRYVHPKTGRSVVIDNETGRVIQLGGDEFDHD